MQIDPTNPDQRTAGIGGSDVSAILGVSPWATPTDVWLEKTRHPSWRRKEQTEEMRWGNLLEPVMRLAYEQDTNRRVHSPGERTYWGKETTLIPWRYAHIDGLVEGEGIWEGKFPIRTYGNWKDGVPVYVQAQVQWYMDITGEPWCDVSALLPGADFRTYRIDSDPETQANIRAAAERFWIENVRAGVPPAELPAKVEYPRHAGDLMIVADDAAEALVTRLALARVEGSMSEAKQEELKEQLRKMIGNAAGMQGQGWRIRWKANRDSEKTDWKLVAGVWRREIEAAIAAGPEEAYNVLTDSPEPDTVIRLYTTITPGARPFVFEEEKPE